MEILLLPRLCPIKALRTVKYLFVNNRDTYINIQMTSRARARYISCIYFVFYDLLHVRFEYQCSDAFTRNNLDEIMQSSNNKYLTTQQYFSKNVFVSPKARIFVFFVKTVALV